MGVVREGTVRPKSVLVIGILGIIFSIFGMCCGAFGVIAAGFSGALPETTGAQASAELRLLKEPAYQRYLIVSAIVLLVLSLWLLVGSILFLQMKPIGLDLMIGYAILSIGSNIVWLVLEFTLLAPVYARHQESPGIASTILGLIYPIAVLIVATRPAIKEQFTS